MIVMGVGKEKIMGFRPQFLQVLYNSRRHKSKGRIDQVIFLPPDQIYRNLRVV